MANGLYRVVLVICCLLFLSACSDKVQEAIESNTRVAEFRLDDLGKKLDSGQVRNAMILTQYAGLLKQDKPELGPLLSQLATDSTRQGPMYQNLANRLARAKDDSAAFVSKDERLAELENLAQATDATLFGDALSDPINVIADMSGGKLARVNAISRETSLQANGASDDGAGSQMVGNPNYGQWQTGSSGMSFWAWYGMYSMFSNLTSPVRYDRWSRSRDYSYYNDYGRHRYSSPSQIRTQETLNTKTKKQFGNKGTFRSPYAKDRTGASKVSVASQQAKSASKFAGRSSYSRASGTSSFRNSSNTRSRSPSRGK